MSKRALCMGINNYPGTHMDLNGCVNDANDWAAELAGRGFTVSKLIDSQATKTAMFNAIQSLITGGVSGDPTDMSRCSYAIHPRGSGAAPRRAHEPLAGGSRPPRPSGHHAARR